MECEDDNILRWRRNSYQDVEIVSISDVFRTNSLLHKVIQVQEHNALKRRHVGETTPTSLMQRHMNAEYT